METCLPEPRQVIKGKVTDVNTFILYFQVEGTSRIYADFTKVPVYLPCVQDDVEIIDPKAYDRSTFTALIGPNTVCNYPKRLNEQSSNTFQQFLMTNKIADAVDVLFAIDRIARKLELFVTNRSVELCIIALYKVLGNRTNKSTLKKTVINTPKDLDLNYATSNPDLYSFLDFDGHCAFNIYYNKRIEAEGECSSQYLFGILESTESHGYFILRDNTSRILVKFMISSDDLHRLSNCVVLVTKYIVFNEIYPNKRTPLLYILLNIENVIVVASCIEEDEVRLYYGKNDECKIEQKYSYFLQTIRISEIIYGYDNSPECWLEAVISYRKTFAQAEHVYAILPKELVKIVLFLKENVVYEAITDQIWKVKNATPYKELYGIDRSRKIIQITPDSVFKETEIPPVGRKVEVLDNFEDIKSVIATLSGRAMFSFILKIDRKKHQRKMYASWFPRRHANLPHFGDSETYQDNLIFRDDDTQTFIDLYLTNRDNHVIPLGLLPNMKVKINHVQVNKNKYLKATVFTNFQIVDYCPEVRFSSVNMTFRDRTWWRWRTTPEPTLLGNYASIPPNCIVYSPVLFRGMLDLHLRVVCLKCRRTSADETCHRCNIKEKFVDVRMVIYAQDSINPGFKIDIYEIDILLALVGLDEQGSAAFIVECVRTQIQLNIDFVKFSEENLSHIAESNPILHRLVRLIRSGINYKFYLILDAVCIKQYTEGRKPWRLITFDILSQLR